MKRNHPSRRNQSGASLIVVLMLLSILLIIGMAALRGSLDQDRMAAQTLDRAIRFQLAEVALQSAQNQLAANPKAPVQVNCTEAAAQPGSDCGPVPVGTFAQAGAAWFDAPTQADGQPQYYVQYWEGRNSNEALGLPEDANYGASPGTALTSYFRVTARAADPTRAAADGRAVVVLQSTMVRE